jgi:hypothetical protein
MLISYRAIAPDVYRISADGIEVGSVSKRVQYVASREYWHWGVSTKLLMDNGGDPPSGEADSFEDALAAFKAAFTTWYATVPLDPLREKGKPRKK